MKVTKNPSIKDPAPIVWAIDPFAVERLKAQENALQTINSYSSDSDLAVQPVYVWDSKSLGAANTLVSVKKLADLILSKWLKPKLQIRLKEIQVLSAGRGTAAQAKTLIDYAKRVGSPLIVANHHMGKGLERWFQGSFCESLSLMSDIPIMVVPPEWKVSAGSANILFPTDFSPASLGAFGSVLEIAKKRSLGVTIFHQVEFPNQMVSEFGSSLANELEDTNDEFSEAMREKAERMKRNARERGVICETLVDDRRGAHVGRRILEEAKRGYAFVAMAAHADSFDRLFVGSNSRFVLRECTCPIWILRPKLPKKTKKLKKTTPRTDEWSTKFVESSLI
jgi:nucleotide-binding universal stress UspA family protein